MGANQINACDACVSRGGFWRIQETKNQTSQIQELFSQNDVFDSSRFKNLNVVVNVLGVIGYWLSHKRLPKSILNSHHQPQHQPSFCFEIVLHHSHRKSQKTKTNAKAKNWDEDERMKEKLFLNLKFSVTFCYRLEIA